MRLDWLAISGFRCHEDLRLEPDPGVNIFVGDNGAGKTSVLEAIGYLVTLSSLRRSPDAALIAADADRALVRGTFSGERRDVTVEVELSASARRKVLVNRKPTQSRTEIAESVALVSFLPDHLDVVKRGPSLRREFLDEAAVQLWPVAATEHREYDRALRQRNALLRSQGRHADQATLDVWDDRVSRLGALVVDKRLAVMEELGNALESIYRDLSGGTSSLTWAYDATALGALTQRPSPSLVTGALLDGLTRSRTHDMERRVTSIGPHRDDLRVEIDGRDTRTRASQGEQRSIAFALRIALHRCLVERRHEAPILLLDDVFSELDAERSQRLVELLGSGQVFVTSARKEEVPLVGQQWTVVPGKVVPL